MQGLALDPASWKKRGKPAAKGIATLSGAHVFAERDATLTILTGTGCCVSPVSQNLALVNKGVEAWLVDCYAIKQLHMTAPYRRLQACVDQVSDRFA